MSSSATIPVPVSDRPQQSVSEQLEGLYSKHAEALKQLDDEQAAKHPAPGKWSKKEELGHLIDSAHNNLRRFIVAQYEHVPHIVYAQDDWVRLNNYNSQPILQLSRFWLLLNQQIVQVLLGMNAETALRQCNTGKEKENLHTLSWLAEDYVRHLKHHLHHILELEPVPY